MTNNDIRICLLLHSSRILKWQLQEDTLLITCKVSVLLRVTVTPRDITGLVGALTCEVRDILSKSLCNLPD